MNYQCNLLNKAYLEKLIMKDCKVRVSIAMIFGLMSVSAFAGVKAPREPANRSPTQLKGTFSYPMQGGGKATIHQDPNSKNVAGVHIVKPGEAPRTIVKMGTKKELGDSRYQSHQVVTNPNTGQKEVKVEILQPKDAKGILESAVKGYEAHQKGK
jgi:hypothetical protein